MPDIIRPSVSLVAGSREWGLWSGVRPKQSPLHVATDYFDTGALDPKWTEVDPDADHTVSVGDLGLEILATPSADDNYGGIVQPAPADDKYNVTARFAVTCRYAVAAAVAALIIGEDLITNPTTASFFTCGVGTVTGFPSTWSSTAYVNYRVFNAVFANNTTPQNNGFYVRWAVDKTAGVAGECTPMMSSDGRMWLRYAPVPLDGTVVSSLDTIGIMTLNQNNVDDVLLLCDMFRVDVTADKLLRVGGAY